MLHRFIRDSYEHAENDESVIDENLEKLKRLLLKFNAKPIDLFLATPRTEEKVQERVNARVQNSALKNYQATIKMMGNKMTDKMKANLQKEFGIVDPLLDQILHKVDEKSGESEDEPEDNDSDGIDSNIHSFIKTMGYNEGNIRSIGFIF